MYKTAGTILIIAACLLMQYARQFAYLQCKIENSTNVAASCDCEKKYSDELNNETGNYPVQQKHIHLTIDEFDIPCVNNAQAAANLQKTVYILKRNTFTSSFNGSIFHPPQS